MIRRTSASAYNEIKENGLLSKRRFEVYEVLHGHGQPATATELFKTLNDSGFSVTGSNIRARLGELRDMGCVVELDERLCSITGMNVIVWALTENLPKDLPKKIGKVQRLRTQVKQLKKEVETITEECERYKRLCEKYKEECNERYKSF